MLNNKNSGDLPKTVALFDGGSEPCAPTYHAPYRILIGNTYHIGKRESQQDSFAISDIMNADLTARKGVFGIVADGMGGMENGAEVSAIVTRTMLQYFNEVDFSSRTELDLLNMLYAANDNVNLLMAGYEQGGSTVVATIIRDGMMYWIAVGDSRIYLARGGSLIQINREHTYAVELDERAAAGEISWEDAIGDPQRVALTSYLGNGKPEKVDRNMRPIKLVSGDRILLLSDGVFGTLTEKEIAETLVFEPHISADEIQSRVLAKQKSNQDNFTAVIIEFKGADL